eukprot:Skav226444  [mRNA]  locus=scaffold2660:360340:367348:+ [translate_table: standard]
MSFMARSPDSTVFASRVASNSLVPFTSSASRAFSVSSFAHRTDKSSACCLLKSSRLQRMLFNSNFMDSSA